MIAEGDAGGVRLLLGLLDGETGPVYERLGLREGEVAPRQRDPWYVTRLLNETAAPASALLWMLETDDPDVRISAYRAPRMSDGLRREIMAGRSFAPGATGSVRPPKTDRWDRPPEPVDTAEYDLLAELYAVRTMAHGRAAAGTVTRDDWPRIAAADHDAPLPGFARWSLAIRIDCPPELRAQFGDHPKFRHRLRQAGIVSGPAEYVETYRPARRVLSLLALGAWAFPPSRQSEAASVLRPLAQSLGPSPEPWAILTQLLPTFTGTLPELLRTTRAVSGV
ncbi:hypothetical protein SRB5_06570 [Streptomyces sp. RB5]|uniref:Uncharacterized protein n=1 Tax=Streptomyces smaragdinus TaxID=2585196 RepID=A0A7K0CAT2_9ACTN|nr:hypothetical protein [Streptomyces smaragdinus]MQY10549.1 hypothetical protein [Streptomyces smaragdinus]